MQLLLKHSLGLSPWCHGPLEAWGDRSRAWVSGLLRALRPALPSSTFQPAALAGCWAAAQKTPTDAHTVMAPKGSTVAGSSARVQGRKTRTEQPSRSGAAGAC